MPIVNIVVLDYNKASVDIFNSTTIRECIDDEDELEVIEEYLTIEQGYNLDEISWMVSPTEIEPNIK